MKRAVFDTNVLLSAFAAPSGIPGQIFDAWADEKFILVLSVYILDEFRRIAEQKLRLPADEVRAALRLFATLAEVVEPVQLSIKEIELADVPIVGTAAAGNADTLVTGDKALFKLEKYRDIRIITPRQFWDEID